VTPQQVRSLVEQALDVHLAHRKREKKERGAALADNSWQCAVSIIGGLRYRRQPEPSVAEIVACIRALAADPAQRLEIRIIENAKGRSRRLFRRLLPGARPKPYASNGWRTRGTEGWDAGERLFRKSQRPR
jgi:hypothetical protein